MSAATALGASVARGGVARPRTSRTSPRAASASASRRERAVGARGALLSGSSTAHPGLGVRRGATAAMLGRAGRMTGRGARSVTTMGLPIPIIGGLFSPAVMSIVYVFVAIKFFLGFNRTNYSGDKKVVMTALWPVLAATNPSFRENLRRATMG
mmetsp:Transcript_982/g.4413  ORF Transcript_982/g.4413 Transcript_982/m.4413 type:complete len:154 (+) Transcript_982:57-518(+)